MKKIKVQRSVIPNMFTSMNMFCGFLSIIESSEGRFIEASVLIIIAAVFDALDGMMARLTKSSSEFGVELDSLSDLVSFGAAPGFLVYKIHLFSLGIPGIIISSLLMIFGAYRLARFNVQLVGFDKAYFKGLPIPSSAITAASFVILYCQDGRIIRPFDTVLIFLVVILAFLMVSTIKYDTLPKFTLQGIKEKPFIFGFLLIAAVFTFITKGKALFFAFLLMIVFGILRHVVSMFSGNNASTEKN